MTSLRPQLFAFAAAFAVATAPGCKSQETKNGTNEVVTLPSASEDASVATVIDAAPFRLPPAPALSKTPLGLPGLPAVDYNPTTAEKVALGAELFSDPAISKTGKTACATCHDPAHGFASESAVNPTDAGSMNQRHAPSLVNMAYHGEFYWDGRSQPLEAHILGHWEGQLGLSADDAVGKLAESQLYLAHFQRAFQTPPSRDRAAEALAAFVRSARQGNSPWDRYEAGDTSAVSADAIAGAAIFNKRAGCATCHAPPLYTDLGFHNLGLPQDSERPDVGREGHTRLLGDRGAFKTPGLRGVSHTAPYFHNGSAATLLQVLEHKESQGSPRLSARERTQLIAFLAALTSETAP